MNKDQKYTPKYWVVNDKTSDDVLLWTANKSMEKAKSEYDLNCSPCVDEDENLELVLIEVKVV